MANTAVKSNLSTGAVNAPPAQPAPLVYSPPSVPPNTVIDRSIAATTGAGINEFLSERPKYFFQIDLADYHRFDGGGNLFQVSRSETTATYVFPLPASLVDIHAIAYDAVSLGLVTGSLVQGATNIAKSDGEARASGGAAIAAGVGGGLIAGGINALAGSKVGSALVGGVANMAGLAGYTPNAFLTILLKGPQYKRHTFRWKVSPRNATESRRLRKMIVDLNNAAAPGTSFGGSLFTFPKIFRCSFMPNSSYLFKMKPAVLESIAIDYSAGGAPAFFRAGGEGLNAPAVVEFQMNFLELEFWLNGDFNEGNDPQNVGNHSSLNGTGIASVVSGAVDTATGGQGNADGSPTSLGNVIQNGQVPGG